MRVFQTVVRVAYGPTQICNFISASAQAPIEHSAKACEFGAHVWAKSPHRMDLVAGVAAKQDHLVKEGLLPFLVV